jgi:hypothetical protein
LGLNSRAVSTYTGPVHCNLEDTAPGQPGIHSTVNWQCAHCLLGAQHVKWPDRTTCYNPISSSLNEILLPMLFFICTCTESTRKSVQFMQLRQSKLSARAEWRGKQSPQWLESCNALKKGPGNPSSFGQFPVGPALPRAVIGRCYSLIPGPTDARCYLRTGTEHLAVNVLQRGIRRAPVVID